LIDIQLLANWHQELAAWNSLWDIFENSSTWYHHRVLLTCLLLSIIFKVVTVYAVEWECYCCHYVMLLYSV